ncbi:MAG TPA: RHS repeat-associated core domain-containing protein, partial [Chthonomonadales bacterium]|nr:RHS repeat-associated core domain-containing protein [Chthonomonadales bacterium]
GVTGYSGTTQYRYNSQDEITQESSTRLGSYSNSFGYDSAFNPTTFRGATLTFNSDNQNTADTFDGNGNPTTYNGTTLTFDAENRMTAYGTAMTAGYRADGLRAWKSNGTTSTYFVYDGITPVCEINSSGAATACNTFGAEGLLARHTSSSVFYALDPQGNPAERLDSSDNLLGSYAFDAFGARSTTDSSPDVYSGYGSQLAYYSDVETGTELLGHRYYDSSQGRFLTRDPVGYAGGIALYGYVGNRVESSADPFGLQAEGDDEIEMPDPDEAGGTDEYGFPNIDNGYPVLHDPVIERNEIGLPDPEPAKPGEPPWPFPGRPGYPPDGGFKLGTVQRDTLPAGTIISQVGDGNSQFTGPDNMDPGDVALPPKRQGSPNHYEVLKPLPILKGETDGWDWDTGLPAPGGGGTQYILPGSVNNLIGGGYLRKCDPAR